MNKTPIIALAVTGALCCSLAYAAPDEDKLGKANGYPALTSRLDYLNQGNLVGSTTSMTKTYDSKVVTRSGPVRVLTPTAYATPIKYSNKGVEKDLTQILDTQRITSLIVLKGDKIITENYQYDRKPDQLFVGYSMSKTLVAILVGAALKDGVIKSLDDTVATYVKELDGSDYGKVTIRNLLRMSSGIKWKELGTTDDSYLAKLLDSTYRRKSGTGAMSFVKRLDADPSTPQGTKWNYNSADTQVLGLVLRAATGKTVTEYTSEKIWSKIGAEADAAWVVDYSGAESVFGYFNARPRDWARMALWMAEGMPDVVTPDYFREMTDTKAQPEYLGDRKIWKYYGYGYQTWLMPYHMRTFQFSGSWGQTIVVQPETKVVAVILKAMPTASGNLEQFLDDIFFWQGILRTAGGNTSMTAVK